MTIRRIGVMGGTFDPIHHGHLVAASEVAYSFNLDTVLFAPTGQPWHKSPAPGATPEERYLMTVLATSQDDRFDVTRVDIDRDGPTYTVDTLRDLRAQHELKFPNLETEWFFITGADALADIMEWRGPQEVIANWGDNYPDTKFYAHIPKVVRATSVTASGAPGVILAELSLRSLDYTDEVA